MDIGTKDAVLVIAFFTGNMKQDKSLSDRQYKKSSEKGFLSKKKSD